MDYIKLILPRYDHDCQTDRFIGHNGVYDVWSDDDGFVMQYADKDIYRLSRQCAPDMVELEQRIVATGGFQV